MDSSRAVRAKLPGSVAAIAVRDRERLVLVVDEEFSQARAEWGSRLALWRLSMSPGRSYGLVLVQEIPAQVPAVTTH